MAGCRGGRKQDRARGEAIVEAAIEVLAEVGYDAMTMDLVAARAGAGKATLYRRWASKNELVLDAVARIKGGTDTDTLPDTRSLRGDVAALFRAPHAGGNDRMPAVMAGLAVMLSRHPELAEAATTAVVEPWITAHRELMRRAIDRGEIPADAAIDTVAPVAPALVAFRLLVTHRPMDLDELLAIVDHVVIPALQTGRPVAAPGPSDRTRPLGQVLRPAHHRTATTLPALDRESDPPSRPGTPVNEETSMSVAATLHLNFAGEARQALEFYQSVFGGRLTIATYADVGAPGDSPDAAAVVFGQVDADNGFRVMAYDVPAAGRSAALAGSEGDRAQTRREHGTTITGERFFVSLNGDDTDEVTVQWEALAKDATVIEPLAPTPWAPLFGMLTDRFGITWSIGVSAP